MDLRDLSSLLVDRMPVALVVLDEAARVRLHNPAFGRMFGIADPSEDMAFGELIEQGALGAFLQDMAALVKGEINDFETTCRYVKDGEPRGWMHGRFVAL